MDKQELNAVIDELTKRFPNARCELGYNSPFELLTAVILSAQCTDKRVNQVTPILFKRYPSPAAYTEADDAELEQYLYPLGFYKNKSKSLKAAAKMILSEYGGEVPLGFDDLVRIPGVGRKTANVILSEAFGQNAFAVDTHVLRVANRLGIIRSDDPYKVELAVTALLDAARLGKAHILLVNFGRYLCVARNPKCYECPITSYCKHYIDKNIKNDNT
ncbi:MAG: endonuclease III [Clostridiales bacterium]|jgi:endonuclease-3|nr:endonuclease III [Clostridiales bacterium]